MAKPTKTQKEVCNALIKQVSWWRDSNDIESPTHYSDMNDCIKADLDGICSAMEIDILIAHLEELFCTVKYLNI